MKAMQRQVLCTSESTLWLKLTGCGLYALLLLSNQIPELHNSRSPESFVKDDQHSYVIDSLFQHFGQAEKAINLHS